MASVHRLPTIAVVTLSAFALLVRILVAAPGGFWRDEALFVAVARLPTWTAVVEFLRGHESHPPLFYGIERIWLSVMGNTDAAAVALPLILGVLLVPLMYWVGSRLFSRPVGLVAATLTTFAPALVEHSALVRPYSLLPMLVLLSSYALVRSIEVGGRAWMAYCATTLALLYTHNWAWLVVAAQWVALAVVLSFGVRRPRAGVVREWLLAQAVVGIGFLPWAPWLYYQSRNAGHTALALDSAGDVVTFVTLALRGLLQATMLGYSTGIETATPTRVAVGLQILPLVVLVVAQFLHAREVHVAPAGRTTESDETVRFEARTALTILLVTPVTAWLIAVILSPFSNMVLTRCLVMLAPLLLLSLSYILVRVGTGIALPAAALALAAFLATYTVTLSGLTHTGRSNAREIAEAVAMRSRPSDLLIVAPEWLASSFNRYYQMPNEQVDFPHFGRETTVDFAGMRDRTVDPRALARMKDKIAEVRRDGRRVWLVMEENDVGTVPSGDIERELRSPNYGVVAKIRANQIRADLSSRFGAPDTSVVTHTPRAKFEQLRVYLFTPGGPE